MWTMFRYKAHRSLGGWHLWLWSANGRKSTPARQRCSRLCILATLKAFTINSGRLGLITCRKVRGAIDSLYLWTTLNMSYGTLGGLESSTGGRCRTSCCINRFLRLYMEGSTRAGSHVKIDWIRDIGSLIPKCTSKITWSNVRYAN